MGFSAVQYSTVEGINNSRGSRLALGLYRFLHNSWCVCYFVGLSGGAALQSPILPYVFIEQHVLIPQHQIKTFPGRQIAMHCHSPCILYSRIRRLCCISSSWREGFYIGDRRVSYRCKKMPCKPVSDSILRCRRRTGSEDYADECHS